MLKQSIVNILKNNKEILLNDFVYNEEGGSQEVAEEIYQLFTSHVVSHKEEELELFEPEDNERDQNYEVY